VVSELVRGVSIALGRISMTECAALDTDGNRVATVDELVRAVAAALSDCPADLAKIDAEIDRLFASSGIAADQVDQVFMIGGTSFVPAIRQLVAARFPVAEFSAEDEFVSVGAGLALCAREHADAA
jgi:hypothetical chaperone protein